MSGLAAEGVRADNVFMSFAVTSESHTLDAYRGRGGYEALAKALRTLQPEDVEREVTASGLRAGAGRTFRWARSGRS
jgi:NADH-quinone oxidoreductase subunit F